jgi:hypothetical protein
MKFTEFNLHDVTFGEYSSKGISLSLPNGDPIHIQIPRLYAPFGLSGFPNQFGPTRYNIDASLRGWNEEGSYVNKFFKFLMNIETVVLDHVRKLDVVPGDPNEFFNSNLKLSEKYDPKFRIKVRRVLFHMVKRRPSADADTTQVDNQSLFFGPQHENMTPLQLEDGLFKGKTFTSVVHLKGVYFFKKQIGLTWTIVDAKVYQPKKRRGPDILPPDVVVDSWADDESDAPPPTPSASGGFAFKLK